MSRTLRSLFFFLSGLHQPCPRHHYTAARRYVLPAPSPSSLALTPSALTSACSRRGPCGCFGPSWPHAPAPGQVKAEHPAGGPLPVPGGCAAGGEAGECPSRWANGTNKHRTGAARTTDRHACPGAPGRLGCFTPTPSGHRSTGHRGGSGGGSLSLPPSETPSSSARPLVPDHPDAKGVPGAPGAARAAGTAGRPLHPPPDDEHQRAGELRRQGQTQGLAGASGPVPLCCATARRSE